MDLKFPPLLWLGLLGAAAVAYAVYQVLVRRSRQANRAIANSSALTRLPAYQHALKVHRRRMAVLAASGVVLCVASLLGAARPLDTTIDRPQTRNRDIMMCLDVSGSMAAFDAELIKTFRALVKDFEGERIGLVIFNGSAATVFPLTDDYDFINGELDTAEKALTSFDYSASESFFAGTMNGRGTSLIGDGLATCVTSFDRVDTNRARSVIFATDNRLAGRPIVTLKEAGELAKAKGVRVYGLNPESDGPDRNTEAMKTVSEGTAGRYFAMNDTAAIKTIVDEVQKQEAALIDSAARSLYSDNPAVPIIIAVLGLAGVIAASRRWRA